ncbi:DedD protein [Gammaproteobacteria bacterium]
MEDNRLKHRLVGATVLVALGVVFFPLWLDMHPAPGTRLEKTNIPEKPRWIFFKSEQEEQQAATAATTPSAVPAVPDPHPVAVASVPASTPSPPVTTPPEIATLSPEQPATVASSPPPSASPSRPNIYATEIKSGTSLNALFAKAGLGNDQVRDLLKLGLPVKALETLQSGRGLWIKSSRQKELQELIYHGQGNKIYAHVIRRGGKLQLAGAASAINVLTGKATTSETKEHSTSIPSPSSLANKHPTPVQETTKTTKVKPRPPAARAPEIPTHPTPSPPAASRSGPASAWVVQIASLNREENARALRDSLRSRGFPAFLESLYEGSNKRWRVRIGPSTDRAEVNNLRGRLEQDTHLPGQVLPYP